MQTVLPTAQVVRVLFSPSDEELVSGDEGGAVLMWSLER